MTKAKRTERKLQSDKQKVLHKRGAAERLRMPRQIGARWVGKVIASATLSHHSPFA